MTTVEQQVEESENGIVFSDEYLATLTKPKLIDLIKSFEGVKKKEKRQEDWGKQFDKWLIHAATKKKEVTFVMATAVSSSPETIKAIPLRIDKYNVQVKCLSDDTEPWLNKNFIIYCV